MAPHERLLASSTESGAGWLAHLTASSTMPRAVPGSTRKGSARDGAADATEQGVPGLPDRDYTFRSRRQIQADPEKGEPAMLETKYRCKACNEEWKEKVPGVLQKAP